ncbi:MAG TPA: nuclear transport factor 2 family protein [Candidatus Binatia bacterium]|nr:nuclear transport factor 2 family protein [Candidatus Binatia bacterium]
MKKKTRSLSALSTKLPCQDIVRRYEGYKRHMSYTICRKACRSDVDISRGLQDVLDRFLTSFYGGFDVRFVAEEFIAAGEHVVALGRIEGKTRKGAVSIDVPYAHVWTVRDGYLQRLRAFTDTAVLAHALAKQ